MKTNFILLAIIFITVSCKQSETESISFYEVSLKETNETKWITNQQEAIKILDLRDTSDEMKNLIKSDEYYNTKALYPFRFGGGCFNGKIEELSASISHDTLYIKWHYPKKNCPGTGEATTTDALLEIDKLKYPDFEKLHIKVE